MSKIKSIIKPFVPPVFIPLIRMMFSRDNSDNSSFDSLIPNTKPDFEYVEEGWKYMEIDEENKGWDKESIVQTQKDKWHKFKALVEGSSRLGLAYEGDLASSSNHYHHNITMIFAYSLTLAARKKDRLVMLDWGGGLGAYYLLARTLLPDIDIEYHCKELGMAAKVGSELSPDQFFYSDDSCLEVEYDFILVSGALQYSEDWQGMLEKLSQSINGYLLVTRLSTIENQPSYAYVQRPHAFGYNTEYVAWCLNKQEFLDKAAHCGLSLRREFVVEPAPIIANAPEQCEFLGFLFERNND